jgi:RNA polymerase sigma-70 factor (ECF subfamily)
MNWAANSLALSMSSRLTIQECHERRGEPEAAVLLACAAGGDADAWGALLTQHQERLQCVLAFRLDPRLRGRVDAADVMQERSSLRRPGGADFFRQRTQSLFLWLRWIVGNTLLELHRHHLGR